MMENTSDVVRVKEEPSDTLTNTGDGYVLDSVDSYKGENFETLPFHEVSAKIKNEGLSLQDHLDAKIFIDFECKDVKPETKAQPTTICKSENQHFQHTAKIENENQTVNSNETLSKILIGKGCNYDNDCRFNVNFSLKLVNYQKLQNCEKNIEKRLLCASKMNRKTHARASLKKLNMTNMALETIRPFECDTCKKSFTQKKYLQSHISAVHDRSKPFECEICYESFGYKRVLDGHINSVHKRSKPFECELCHKSYGFKAGLKRHVTAVHDCSKPFECEICHKSYGYKDQLKIHINAFIIIAHPSSVRLVTNHLYIKVSSKPT
ncbi:zinc finger and BTB domain-containing protein 6-like [Trichogramma pretiosum]|uniref:zinc finger and BTB domain-containing protein 6-like n=1 Tax=Trichogramma pretiosum TaxID=7493 RepID=UPI000C71B386|nr:zinc finger and BTB domain-containing protein 6-like [Trichogramma pretiosum]